MISRYQELFARVGLIIVVVSLILSPMVTSLAAGSHPATGGETGAVSTLDHSSTENSEALALKTGATEEQTTNETEEQTTNETEEQTTNETEEQTTNETEEQTTNETEEQTTNETEEQTTNETEEQTTNETEEQTTNETEEQTTNETEEQTTNEQAPVPANRTESNDTEEGYEPIDPSTELLQQNESNTNSKGSQPSNGSAETTSNKYEPSTHQNNELTNQLDTTLSLQGEAYILDIGILPDGDYAIVGKYQDLEETYVARVSPDASVSWVQNIGLDEVGGLTTTSDGGIIVVGDVAEDDNSGIGPHIYRLNSAGFISYETASFVDTTYNDVVVHDGLIYAVGQYAGDPVVVTHDLANGVDDSSNPDLGRFQSDGTLSGITTTNNGLVAVGQVGGNPSKAYALGFTNTGDQLVINWESERGTLNLGRERYSAVVTTSANNVIALGTADQSEVGRGMDALVTKLETGTGETIWSQRFGSAADDLAYDIVRVGDRVLTLTYPGADEVDDGRTAKVTRIAVDTGNQAVITSGANEGDIFTSAAAVDGSTFVMGAAESPDIAGREAGPYDSGLVRNQFGDGSTPISPKNGLAIHDGFAYVISDGQIKKIDLSTNSVVNSYAAPSGSANGLTYGGGSLWFADGAGSDYDGEIVELDPETGDVRSRIQAEYDITGLAYGDGTLWATDITFNNVVEYTPAGERVSSFDVRDATGTTSPQALAYFDGSLWLGTADTNGLYEFGTDGSLIQTATQRDTGYNGLAANGTALLGSDSSGHLTVLRTRTVQTSLSVSFPNINNGQITGGAVDVEGTALGVDQVLFVAIGPQGSVVTERLTTESDGTIRKQDIAIDQLAAGQATLHVVSLGRDGDVGDGVVPGSQANTLSGLENYIQTELAQSDRTASQIRSALRSETTFDAASDDRMVSQTVEITTTGSGTEDLLAADSSSRTVSAGSEVTLTYTVTNTLSQPRNILIELTAIPDNASVSSVGGAVEQDLTGSTPPGVITQEVAAGESVTVQVTLDIAEDATATDRDLTAVATVTAGSEVVATDMTTTTLSITKQDPIVARFGGSDGEIGNIDVLRAVNAANSGREIGGEPVSNLDVLQLVNRATN